MNTKLLVCENNSQFRLMLESRLFVGYDIITLGTITGQSYDKIITVNPFSPSKIEMAMLNEYINDYLKTKLRPGGELIII